MTVESPIGLKDILTVLGWSRWKFFNRKQELVSAGLVFYVNEGSPPRKRIRAYASRLMDWVQEQAKMGRTL